MRLRLTPLIAALAFALAPAAHAGITPRIVGGTTASAGAYPYMAALVDTIAANDPDGVMCGGTVIAPYAILTAAHCVDGPNTTVTRPVTDFVVVTGKTDLSAPTGGQHLAIRRLVPHPGYTLSALSIANDLAVILLASPTSATPVVRDSGPPLPGTTATAIGWGASSANPPSTFLPQLQQATLPINVAADCLSPGVICAGAGTPSTPSICLGDSGGPLLVTTAGVTRQAGIASAILTPPNQPPVCGVDSSEFTDVSKYTSWIDAQLAPAVSGVAVAAVVGKLRVTWQRTPGGAEPAAVVRLSDGSVHPAPAGSTSLDIAALPLRTALGATVTVTNPWGAASAVSGGTATLVAAPAISGVAATAQKIGGQVATNGLASAVTAEYGPDAAHLTTTAATNVADAADAATVAIPFGPLAAGRTYRARLIAQNTAGRTVSAWVTFAIPATRPVSTLRPKVIGAARVGKTLTCGRGKWTAAPAPTYVYGWRIGGKVSKTQKTSTLKLTRGMLGKRVSCIVTAKNAAAAVAASSTAVTVRRR